MKILAVLCMVCLVRLCYGKFSQTRTEGLRKEGVKVIIKKLQDSLKSKEVQSVQPTSPSDFKSKVDSTLFNVEEGEEDAVKVLKLTVKNGSTVKELKYDGEKIWSSGIFGSCSSAVLYFYGGIPVLAVLKTKGLFGRDYTVYKHLDGSKWKNGNESDCRIFLDMLKEMRKSELSSPNPTISHPYTPQDSK